jgi:hypothetical protein
MKTRWLLLTLLASCALNLYLLVARPSIGAANASPMASSAAAERARPALPAMPGSAASAAADRSGPACDARVQALSAEVVELKALTKKYVPAKERYAHGDPDPESTERIAPELARIFGPTGVRYDIDCRDGACRLAVVSRRDEKGSEWMKLFQEDPKLPPLTRGLEYASEPWDDPATGDGYLKSELFLTLTDPEGSDGLAIVSTLIDSFKSGPSLADCTGHFRDAGSFLANVSLSDDGQWGFGISGTLAETQTGRCLSDRLRAAAASIPVRAPVVAVVNRPLFLRSPPP